MATKTFSCGASPELIVTAEGDLSVTGWDQESIEAQFRNEEDLSVEQADDRLTFIAERSLMLKVPYNSLLQINLVDGSIEVSSVGGAINIQSVGGHLKLQATGPVTCGSVGGHLKFVNTTGEICARNVGGNFKGSQAAAPVSVSNVGGSIKLLDVILSGKVHAGGNIKVKLPENPQELEAYAGGNVKLWVPDAANFELEAHSGGEKVVVQSASETQRFGNGHFHRTIGEGGPLVRLHAGGNVYIMTSGWEDDLMTEDFFTTGEFADQMSNYYDERIQKKIEARMRQAEIKASAASRRAEEKINAAMRKMEKLKSRGVGSPFSVNWPQSSEEPSAQATDEERMIILNMLSEKKITAEEANQLLDALNGKFE